MSNNLLYKYSAFSANSMSLLINREVYFSDPSHFNDPYDCQISLLDAVNAAVEHAETVTKKGVKDKLSKLKGLNHIFEKMESDLKNLGIFSLSRTCENVLMWSHYAEDHKGFCLGFKLSDKFHTWNEHDKVIGCHDVIYTKSNPFLNYFIDFAKSEKASKRDDFWMSLTILGLLSKSKAWKYEEEVRVFRRIPGMVSFSPTDLVEVIFGLNMNKKNRSTISNLLSGGDWNHVRFKKVIREEHSFNLKVVNL